MNVHVLVLLCFAVGGPDLRRRVVLRRVGLPVALRDLRLRDLFLHFQVVSKERGGLSTVRVSFRDYDVHGGSSTFSRAKQGVHLACLSSNANLLKRDWSRVSILVFRRRVFPGTCFALLAFCLGVRVGQSVRQGLHAKATSEGTDLSRPIRFFRQVLVGRSIFVHGFP